MRRGLVLLLGISIVSLLGCELRGRLLHAELPLYADVDPRDVDYKPLPVVLHDVTDLVTSIEIGDPVGPDGEPWIKVRAVDGAPDALKVDWMGGACVAGIQIVFEQVGGQQFALALEEQRSLGGMLGCTANGVFRSVVLHLSAPVLPENIRLDYSL